IIEKAIKAGTRLEMTYVSAKDGTRRQIIVAPEKVALNREGAAVLVATDVATNTRLSYAIMQIERARTQEGAK
ncbi:MAG: hypothetical protein FJ102_21900, partial [Deltaproteobacteria bacterium]|nr:hypothetical protein [Deltaproteobacteria bacterium]